MDENQFLRSYPEVRKKGKSFIGTALSVQATANARPIDNPRNLAVIKFDRMVNGSSSILYVTHDEDDGGWQAIRDAIGEPWRRSPVGQ